MAKQKQLGQYFTPAFIVDYIIENSVGEWIKDNPQEKECNIIDPACGDGAFLDGLRKYQDKIDIKLNIYGVDIDKEVVDICINKGYDVRLGNALIDDKSICQFAFNWQDEFESIFKNGGFDCVVGNPPWVSLIGKFGSSIITQEQIDYLLHKYNGNTAMPNLYEYFVHKGMQIIKKEGYSGLIIPDRLGFNNQFVYLREKILKYYRLIEVFYKFPFPNVIVDTMVLIVQNSYNQDYTINIKSYDVKESKEIKKSEYMSHKEYQFYFNKIVVNNSILLSTICSSTSGFGGKSQLITKEKVSNNQISVIKGLNIDRYIIKSYLFFEFKKENITGRTTDKNKLGKIEKILIRKTGNKIIASIDESGNFPEQSLYFLYDIKVKKHFLLAILNSKFISYLYNEQYVTNKNSTPQIKKVDLDNLPIPHATTQQQEELSKLAKQMIDLNTRLAKSKIKAEKQVLERQLKATDKLIDSKVYALYGLTEEEIKVVEG